ncbi:MAG: MerR family transcriptional regulator [Myxococcales bacterium]|nr:MerR family transcriptional regulator [Myxococcales bacterium]
MNDSQRTRRSAPPEVDRERYPYRMKDLCDLTGLERQVIHFYIQQGLVPPGFKKGRNMAFYGEEHLERIQLVRQLQHERFLPLKAIRAIIEGQDDHFTPEQRVLLSAVKARIGDSLGAPSQGRRTIDVAPLLEQHGVKPHELVQLAELGLLTTMVEKGVTRVPEDDAWVLELWGQLRSAGFSSELGFEVKDLAPFETAVGQLFEAEKSMLTERLADLPPEEVAQLVMRALPLITTFITRFHEVKIRNFFSALG